MRDRGRAPEWKDVRPGLGLLAAIAVVLATIFFLNEARRAVEEGPRLVVVTAAAPLLEPGSTVWVAGRPAGRVLSVRFRDPHAAAAGAGAIVVEAVLRHEAAAALRNDATARIEQSGLLAPVVLSLGAGSRGRPPFDFSDTLTSTVGLLDQDRALARFDTLRRELERTRPLARRLRSRIEEGPGTLAGLRRDSSLLAALGDRLRTLEDLLVGGPGGGRGTLARLAADTSLSAGLARARSNLRLLAADEEPARKPGRQLPELLAALDGLQGSLIALERDLEAGRGTLGRALADTAVLQQARLLSARLDSLRAELLAHPLRWLRIRLF